MLCRPGVRAELLRPGPELLREEVLPREAMPSSSPLLQVELLRPELRSDLRRCPLVRR